MTFSFFCQSTRAVSIVGGKEGRLQNEYIKDVVTRPLLPQPRMRAEPLSVESTFVSFLFEAREAIRHFSVSAARIRVCDCHKDKGERDSGLKKGNT